MGNVLPSVKSAPGRGGLWHGLPKEKPHEEKCPPAHPASLHSRSAWSVGARWDVALPLTMVSAVRCAKRARAPTSPLASARDSTESGAASPGHPLPAPGGCSLSSKALKDQYKTQRCWERPLQLERAHGKPPAPSVSLCHQGIAAC